MREHNLGRWSTFAVFASGVFFGGTIDHLILAAIRSPISPYGLQVGVIGNWALAGIDLAIAFSLYAWHRRLVATSAFR